MPWRALRGYRQNDGWNGGVLVDIASGLVPRPLTLFVMICAMQCGVTEAELAFSSRDDSQRRDDTLSGSVDGGVLPSSHGGHHHVSPIVTENYRTPLKAIKRDISVR